MAGPGDIFNQMTDSELDNVVSYGGLSADTANQIKAARAPKVLAPNNSAPAPAMGPAEQNEVMADQMTGYMKGTPLQDNSMYPAPLAAPHGQEQAATQDATRQVAAQKVQMATAEQQVQAQNQKAADDELKDKQNEEKVKADLDSSDSNWGSKIGQAVSIMLGAYSQGFTGSKTNPAVEAIDKQLNLIAKQKKYSDDQKIKMAELMYKQADLELKKRKDTTDSMIGLKKLDQADQELQVKIQELQMKKQERQATMGTRFTKEQVATIPAKDREALNLVRLPDGTFGSALSGKQANDLSEMNSSTDSALMSAHKLMDKINYFGNNPAKKIMDRESAAEVKSLVQGLVGGMRLSYFGPGVFSDREQKIAATILGNPNAIFSLSSANKAALNTVMDKLKFARRTALRNSLAIDLPPSANDKKLQEYKKAAPGLTEGQMIENLKATNMWQDED